MIKEMLKAKIIKPSKSPWASPSVIKTEKNENLRFFIDFRKLNNLTIPDSHPLSRIDSILDYLYNTKIFSKIDLASGYFYVPVDPGDTEKTAFTTPVGFFEFTVMPFGLKNAPVTFPRMMELSFSELIQKNVLIYLDDIVIFSRTLEDHLRDLENAFNIISSLNLKKRGEKCHFFKEEKRYIGFHISKDGIRTDPDKTESIKNWKTPTFKKDGKTFLGFLSYYRQFIPNLANMEATLRSLTKQE